MITLALSATIRAPAERVWRALVDPDERVEWDQRVLGGISPETGKWRGRSASAERISGERTSANSSGGPLRTNRWRFRLSGVPLVMVDRVVNAEPGTRLVSKIAIGSMQFEQTLTLQGESDETGFQTRLGMKLVARNSIAVIGEVVPRTDVQKLIIEYIDTTLRQVQKYCEADA